MYNLHGLSVVSMCMYLIILSLKGFDTMRKRRKWAITTQLQYTGDVASQSLTFQIHDQFIYRKAAYFNQHICVPQVQDEVPSVCELHRDADRPGHL